MDKKEAFQLNAVVNRRTHNKTLKQHNHPRKGTHNQTHIHQHQNLKARINTISSM